MPAAVEVAIYRIAQEALTNVVRHAHACRCDLRLALDEAAGLLTLSIQDDGCGLSPSWDVGVGLISMRERAEELGGTWTIEPVKSGGTRVLAWLPYVCAEPADELVVPRPGAFNQRKTRQSPTAEQAGCNPLVPARGTTTLYASPRPKM